MIPGSFEYHRPATLAAAAGLLAELGEEARVLAGGHSLIPMMKLRMAAPAHLVDLQGIDELSGIAFGEDAVTIGAMTTQHALIENAALAEAVPLIREAALQIADPQVRYQGTIGGNVANGDPGNDMPGLMQCLGAQFELTGKAGTRFVAARSFYRGAFETARADDEILARIHVPLVTRSYGWAYEKQKRKIGDYATAAAAVLVYMRAGQCIDASVTMTNLSDTPVHLNDAQLAGTDLGPEAMNDAVAVMQASIRPSADNRGPAEFKRHVAGVILRRAIQRAATRTR